ncbi:GNAT family N-acetyltransferase [Arthrobacter sp.]|uniref:GNAT family N-acetyltransferase n=1 Tax=Arthrobacter sp. TaxID=1667 RepID=UPI0025887808|nr:GNAT family N-acetyltransferase [Arthrobacter sp.]
MSDETAGRGDAVKGDAFEADVTMTRNDARHRYELHVGAELGVIILFRELPGHIDLIHTETQDGFEGRGLAKVLARYALDDVVASGKRIIPHCPYVARFVEKNPELYTQYTDFPAEL